MEATRWVDINERKPPFNTPFWAAIQDESISLSIIVCLLRHDNAGWFDILVGKGAQDFDDNRIVAWKPFERPASPEKRIVWE